MRAIKTIETVVVAETVFTPTLNRYTNCNSLIRVDLSMRWLSKELFKDPAHLYSIAAMLRAAAVRIARLNAQPESRPYLWNSGAAPYKHHFGDIIRSEFGLSQYLGEIQWIRYQP
jgi:hypothetical protein